ncbi:hypothetical protein [Halobacterium wangiae]|uniref:hypothetical protein n=1 Tax=Halobacterium wangiae TaxID=2902623 RepID=UPI001E600881|nr:hypothetical protein [Halobacterium wangiae]
MTDEQPETRRQLREIFAADPRLDEQYVRVIPAADGDHPVVVVGVAHDHPASVYRARTVAAELEPGTLALELPNVLVGLFESYAAAGGDEGGEMAGAIDATTADEIVGVDVPGRRSVGTLLSELRAADPDLDTAARAVYGFGRFVTHTALGRLREAGVPDRWVGSGFERTRTYDCAPSASPDEQAAHESAHLKRSSTLLRAFDPPQATRILDATRERFMGRRLAALRKESSVVAVVGYGHLDGIEAAVRADSA